MHNRPLTPEQSAALVAALQVLVLDPRHLRWLQRYDPKALLQACDALRQAGAAEIPMPECQQPIDALIPGACERPAGHGGPCRAYSLETGGSVDLRPTAGPPARSVSAFIAECDAADRRAGQTPAAPASDVVRETPTPAPLHHPLCTCERCRRDPRRGRP